jgi:hypothetical protein
MLVFRINCADFFLHDFAVARFLRAVAGTDIAARHFRINGT